MLLNLRLKKRITNLLEKLILIKWEMIIQMPKKIFKK